MKSYKDQDLKKLRDEWYKKLRDSGFNDIEDASEDLRANRKIKSSFHGRTPSQRRCKEEYFLRMSQTFANPETKFRNEIDRLILKRYLEGALIRQIVDELEGLGTPKERKTIRILIRRYEMAWNVRYYTDRQLNRKPGKPKLFYPGI